jgi:cytochrome c oxidase assembly protein subunit 15
MAPCRWMSRRLAALRERRPVSPRAHEIAAWSALVLFTVIVVTGAGVRLTGSGLGCPDWPRCNDASLTPQHGHAFIEFGNRLITTPVTLAALACLVTALLRRPYRRDFTVIGGLLVAGVLVQAVLGGITVLTGLNPATVMGHFLLSMATLFAAVLLVWRVRRERAGTPAAPLHDARLVGAARGLFAFGAVVVVLGTMVTASGPYAGGEGTGDDVHRLTIFGYDTFQNVIALHARLAGTFGVLAVALWLVARRMGARDLRAPLTAVCLVVAVAGLIGNLQYHQLDYPAWLVWLHVSVATLLWTTLCWTVLAAGRPVRLGVPGAAPTGPAAERPELVTSDT